MQAKIYYMRGDVEFACTTQVDTTFRNFCDRLSQSMGSTGLFISGDFAFPLKSIYYIEKLED